MSIYNHFLEKPNGEILSMETYRNKTLLIVNTASQCDFTYQYEDLQRLYDKYKEKDFVILGLPSNQFGSQNPEDGETTRKKCMLHYGVQFPMFNLIEVNGPSAHPLYVDLKNAVTCRELQKSTMQDMMLYNHVLQHQPDFLRGNNIRWNFTKFLVSNEGKVLQRFEPNDSMLDIETAIENALAERAAY
ncbi:glutathione peroxidase [Metasolibacillus meyeri]|uniref:glutathione peroxidase n=1 Tax=Metasolibacillus meyeri TaxID=1071052 RepID=UPI000D3046D8|nr:glutathione peroxidase [Metasolibacillus meyeri]